MKQELKALRDFLRQYGGDGLILRAANDYHGLTLTAATTRELAGVLDGLEQESEHVGGVQRDV